MAISIIECNSPNPSFHPTITLIQTSILFFTKIYLIIWSSLDPPIFHNVRGVGCRASGTIFFRFAPPPQKQIIFENIALIHQLIIIIIIHPHKPIAKTHKSIS
jgi:hypothetical protein